MYAPEITVVALDVTYSVVTSETIVPDASVSSTKIESALVAAAVPITELTTVALAVVALPKNVIVSVARTTPAFDWISIVDTPDDPSE